MSNDSFWECDSTSRAPDVWTVIAGVVGTTSIALNGFTLWLLFLIDGKTRTSLLMLRTLVACCIFVALLNLLEGLYPLLWFSRDTNLERAICSVLLSKFLRWTFFLIGLHAHVYFVINRTIQIVSRLQFSFTTSKYADLAYVALFAVFSLFLTFPQCFLVGLQDGRCRCFQGEREPLKVAMVYAEAFIFFVEIFVANSVLLAVSFNSVRRWRVNTPKENRIDTLNQLCFVDSTEEEIAQFDATRGWKSASNCMLPLAIIYPLATATDCFYHFLAAMGLFAYKIGGPLERAAQTLMLIYPLGVPLIILFYIPALRFYVTQRVTACTRGVQDCFRNVGRIATPDKSSGCGNQKELDDLSFSL